jgi:hypothetical protein
VHQGRIAHGQIDRSIAPRLGDCVGVARCLVSPVPTRPHPSIPILSYTYFDQLYWENDSLDDTVSLVPTSAVSGEGVPDLLMMLITLTQVPSPI